MWPELDTKKSFGLWATRIRLLCTSQFNPSAAHAAFHDLKHIAELQNGELGMFGPLD